MLVDNASLDKILSWNPQVRSRFRTELDQRRFIIYLAPETAAELLSLGATSRVGNLSSLAALTLELFNGRFLNHYFSRILAEVKGLPSSPFLAGGLTRRWLRNISECAKEFDPHEHTESFSRLEEMVRREKEDDQRLRKKFQEMYRNSDQQNMPNRSGTSLVKFAGSRMSQEHEQISVEAICEEAGVRSPRIRALEIIRRNYARCPTLATHIHIRIARAWWYTESTRDGRRVGIDLFDDALLNYLTELDVLITPDQKLIEFGKIVVPDKELITPNEFLEKHPIFVQQQHLADSSARRLRCRALARYPSEFIYEDTTKS
jgi:hypothetical protein